MPEITLPGRTILITRPQPEANSTAQQVIACQGYPLLAPALTILPPRDAAPLQRALHTLHPTSGPPPYRGILVTSANGARAIVAAMPTGATPPPFFAVGEKTARLLRQQGWSVQVPPAAAGGEALAHAILQWTQSRQNAHDSHTFLFPQAEQGREELTTCLQQAGYGVERVTAYRAEPITALPPETQTAIAEDKVDAVLFFSGRTAQAFVAALTPHDRAWLAKSCIAVLSPVTALAVRQLGYTATVTATEPSSRGLLAALHHHWSAGPAQRR
ncbi:MAG: uroporphyrinogen-III synthase [Magnetococcales bacterium]|nr:uroporphyrinogen-III synthase [Magnetococcales bacterium]